jgi:hypothetical protein
MRYKNINGGTAMENKLSKKSKIGLLIVAALILVVVIAVVVISVFTRNKEGTTLKWSEPLSELGSYLGEGDLPDTTATQYGWKRIVYTDINGETAYADPYKSGSITTAEGTDVILQMYTAEASTQQSAEWIYDGKTRNGGYGKNGELVSAPYAPPSSGKLYVNTDHYTSKLNCYTWFVVFE